MERRRSTLTTAQLFTRHQQQVLADASGGGSSSVASPLLPRRDSTTTGLTPSAVFNHQSPPFGSGGFSAADISPSLTPPQYGSPQDERLNNQQQQQQQQDNALRVLSKMGEAKNEVAFALYAALESTAAYLSCESVMVLLAENPELPNQVASRQSTVATTTATNDGRKRRKKGANKQPLLDDEESKRQQQMIHERRLLAASKEAASASQLAPDTMKKLNEEQLQKMSAILSGKTHNSNNNTTDNRDSKDSELTGQDFGREVEQIARMDDEGAVADETMERRFSVASSRRSGAGGSPSTPTPTTSEADTLSPSAGPKALMKPSLVSWGEVLETSGTAEESRQEEGVPDPNASASLATEKMFDRSVRSALKKDIINPQSDNEEAAKASSSQQAAAEGDAPVFQNMDSVRFRPVASIGPTHHTCFSNFATHMGVFATGTAVTFSHFNPFICIPIPTYSGATPPPQLYGNQGRSDASALHHQHFPNCGLIVCASKVGNLKDFTPSDEAFVEVIASSLLSNLLSRYSAVHLIDSPTEAITRTAVLHQNHVAEVARGGALLPAFVAQRLAQTQKPKRKVFRTSAMTFLTKRGMLKEELFDLPTLTDLSDIATHVRRVDESMGELRKELIALRQEEKTNQRRLQQLHGELIESIGTSKKLRAANHQLQATVSLLREQLQKQIGRGTASGQQNSPQRAGGGGNADARTEMILAATEIKTTETKPRGDGPSVSVATTNVTNLSTTGDTRPTRGSSVPVSDQLEEKACALLNELNDKQRKRDLIEHERERWKAQHRAVVEGKSQQLPPTPTNRRRPSSSSSYQQSPGNRSINSGGGSAPVDPERHALSSSGLDGSMMMMEDDGNNSTTTAHHNPPTPSRRVFTRTGSASSNTSSQRPPLYEPKIPLEDRPMVQNARRHEAEERRRMSESGGAQRQPPMRIGAQSHMPRPGSSSTSRGDGTSAFTSSSHTATPHSARLGGQEEQQSSSSGPRNAFTNRREQEYKKNEELSRALRASIARAKKERLQNNNGDPPTAMNN